VHWITTDQLLFKGSLSNEWTIATLAESDFFVLLLDPTFQMNRTHGDSASSIQGSCYICVVMKRSG
jgi:hypothetical protein